MEEEWILILWGIYVIYEISVLDRLVGLFGLRTVRGLLPFRLTVSIRKLSRSDPIDRICIYRKKKQPQARCRPFSGTVYSFKHNINRIFMESMAN